MVCRKTGFRKRYEAMMSPAMISYASILMKTFFWKTSSSTSGSRVTSVTSMMLGMRKYFLEVRQSLESSFFSRERRMRW